jgi:electron transport complex protein RnfD
MGPLLPSSPHVHGYSSVAAVMQQVLFALVPGVAALLWCFGWGPLVNMAIAALVALATEAAMLAMRRRPVVSTLRDSSALVTALLLAIAIPPLSPWWITALGVAFAMVFGKHLYGGLGHNPFNPAMVGYVVLLISFPLEMTVWPRPYALDLGPLQTLSTIFGNLPPGLDGMTSATPLDMMKTQLGMMHTVEEIRTDPLFSTFSGTGWEWVNGGFLAGGLWLLYQRVIAWQIPAAMLGSLFALALLFFAVDPDTHPSPVFHIFSGAAMVGAFFIATDPVSASTTPRGRLIYGAGIGALTYIIRTWGGYPDGVAFAVLLMNMATPTIDYYTQPHVFGAPEDKSGEPE